MNQDEPIEYNETLHAFDNIVVWEHACSSEVEIKSVNDDMEYVMRITHPYVSRISSKSKTIETVKRCYAVRNKKRSINRCPVLGISSTVGYLKTSYFDREY